MYLLHRELGPAMQSIGPLAHVFSNRSNLTVADQEIEVLDLLSIHQPENAAIRC
jgi:hypothetical protein